MGMGHLDLRRWNNMATEWKDKSAKSHKHEYTVRAILEITEPNGAKFYYNVMKCAKCKSFKSIPEEKNEFGMINRPLTKEEKSLPLIRGRKTNYLLGFHNIKSVEID